MDIVKQINGSVQFVRSGVVVQTLLENVTANLNEKRNGLFIVDTRGRKVEIFTRSIENTQLLPAVAIKFQPGNTVDLWNVLFDLSAAPFFTELHISLSIPGGGGVVETNWITVAIAAYALLLTDYQIRVTVVSTLTLPTIAAASIGRIYRIFSRNVKVTINRSGADTINGNTSILLNKWDAVTLRATAAGDWGIGD